ncbi:hypothetical protein GOP47_0003673 [Adiantum capillus-veneris]|uniref:Cyclin-like domain-containing protein n=1 Tax=Adiantum capillus-veneris TaxID=13818 RepID=A0A9D4V623_ADICA|nr:hypothetical protein GOP47_0003673 [Adiantum capillus-veneris]
MFSDGGTLQLALYTFSLDAGFQIVWKTSWLIATSCMFLAGKVEETPQKLCDVIFLSYEIRNKKDPTALQRIKQKDLYEPQKELVLLGERLVLTTLGFDLNIHHPYKPLVAAIKKFKVAQNALAQVAWNFVNDGLRTSLCLQFKPHHIAAGAIFLAAKFLKVKLPSEGEKVWWQEFEVTPRQLEEVSNQMLELYEQNREAPASRASDPSASGNLNRAAGEAPTSSSVQVSDKNLPEDVKARGNANIVRSVDEAVPSTTDHRPDTNIKETVDQKARIGSDPEMKPASTLVSESSLVQESKKLTDVTCNNNASNEVSLLAPQLLETKSPVEGECNAWTKDINRHSAVVSHPGVQVVEDISDWKSKETIDSTRAADASLATCTQTSEGILSAFIEEVEQTKSLRQQSQPKSEWVDLADVNIDRVKAAIQRRKKRDKRPLVAKRELTDEEELLEMDLENGCRDVQCEPHHSGGEVSAVNSDLEAEELLENSLEGGKGGQSRKSHLKNQYDERFHVNRDGCHWVDSEKHDSVTGQELIHFCSEDAMGRVNDPWIASLRQAIINMIGLWGLSTNSMIGNCYALGIIQSGNYWRGSLGYRQT